MERLLAPRRYILITGILIVLIMLVYQAVLAPPTLAVTVLTVGKGDATLVRTPDGATILVDAGPDASILRALGEMLPEWQRRIDVVVLTSAAAGSAGGLPEVLHRYRVAMLFRAGAPGSKSLETALAAAASAQSDLQQTAIPYGMRLSFTDGTALDISAPAVFNVSNGEQSLAVSSSTPLGVSLLIK